MPLSLKKNGSIMNRNTLNSGQVIFTDINACDTYSHLVIDEEAVKKTPYF